MPDPGQRDRDHRPPHQPTTRRPRLHTHLATRLSPGDLFRPVLEQDPHTVTEVHRTRDRRNGADWITLVDQYANPYSYRSNEPVPTAVPDPSTV